MSKKLNDLDISFLQGENALSLIEDEIKKEEDRQEHPDSDEVSESSGRQELLDNLIAIAPKSTCEELMDTQDSLEVEQEEWSDGKNMDAATAPASSDKQEEIKDSPEDNQCPPPIPADLLYAAIHILSTMNITKCLVTEEKKGEQVKFDLIFRVNNAELVEYMKKLPLAKKGRNMCSSDDVEYVAKGVAASVSWLSETVNILIGQDSKEKQALQDALSKPLVTLN